MKSICINKQDGFTLIEVILSIAILSIVSVVVLRLFVTSHDLNESSRTADLASNSAANIIENIRGYRNLETLTEELPWLDNNSNVIEGTMVYDDDFSQQGTPAYTLVCSMTPDTETVSLYNLTVHVKDLNDKDIVSYSTKHYFSEGVTE